MRPHSTGHERIESRRKVTLLVAYPSLTTALLFILTGLLILGPAMEREWREWRTERIRERAHAATMIISAIEASETLSIAEAKEQAFALVRNLRTSSGEHSHIWVVDHESRILLHTARPDLQGKLLNEFMRSGDLTQTNKPLELALPALNDSNNDIGEMAFVESFAPWQWHVGAGRFNDSLVQNTIFAHKRVVLALALSCAIILLLSLASHRRRCLIDRETRQRQANMIKAQNHIRSVLSSTRQVAIIATDESGIISHFNEGAELILGYDSKEVVGKHTPLLFHLEAELLASLTPTSSDTSGGEAAIDIFLNKVNQVGQVEFETRWRKHDGEMITVSLAVSSLHIGAAINGISLVAQDITEFKKAEEALRDSERRLNLHTNQTPMGVIQWDLDFKARRWNPAAGKIFGYGAEDAIGKHARDLIMTAANKEHIYNAWGRAVQMRERVQERGKHLDVNGRTIYCEWFSTPLINEDNEVIGVTSLVNDITEHLAIVREKEQLEYRLQQGRKMEAIGTLAGGIAHDFNNILFSATGFTEIALKDLPPDSRAASCLQESLQAQWRAADLIDQILTFSRQGDEVAHPLALDAIIEGELKLLRASLPTTITIRTAIKPDCGLVNVAEVHIHQILMNLCTNAAQAMSKDGGILEISLSKIARSELDTDTIPLVNVPEYLCLSVSDTGIGIDLADRERIFTPYFTTKEGGEGTGLGLATVHGIVESLGGTITVHGDVKRGTCFKVYLPRCEELEPEFAEDDRDGKPVISSRGETPGKILFIDDEQQIANFARLALQDMGFAVEVFTSSRDALTAFTAQPETFDLVITDQTMPEITGGEITKAILKLRPDLPIILCTGFSDILTKEQALELGVIEYLVKPFRIQSLKETIYRILDTRSETAQIIGKGG
ncbi:MAG: PAS domain S-box protein [bacterium]|nr:PAS domain S-box protein [bacterium]